MSIQWNLWETKVSYRVELSCENAQDYCSGLHRSSVLLSIWKSVIIQWKTAKLFFLHKEWRSSVTVRLYRVKQLSRVFWITVEQFQCLSAIVFNFTLINLESGALRSLTEIVLQSSAASCVAVRSQARKEQERKCSAYLLRICTSAPLRKDVAFYNFSFPATLLWVHTALGEKSVCVCLIADFIFQLSIRGIQSTGSTGNFKNLSQRQNLETMKSSRSNEATFLTVEEFYLMSKAVCRSRLRAQWEFHDLQPVSICRQTGSK